MIDLRRLTYFAVLAEELHFGRAAARLGIAQPPLSQQIRVFEGEVGARLFDRTNRQVTLTPAGAALLPEARKLLAQADRALVVVARAQRGEMGELRIGFTGSAAFGAVVPRLIGAYRRQAPEVHLHLREMTTQQQLAAMLDGTLDIAFVRSPERPVLPPTLQAVHLLADALLAVVPPQHRLADTSGDLSVAELATEDFVMYPRESGTGVYDQILALCRGAGFAPRIAQEAQEAATIVGLVAAGLGVSLVPASMQSIVVNGVVYRPLAEAGARSALWLVMRAHGLSAQEAAFLSLGRRTPRPRGET